MDDSRYKELWDRQEKLDERIRAVENTQAGTIVYIKEIKADLQEIKSELKKISQCDIKPKISFWQTDSGKLVIKTLCIMGTLLIMAVIGINYFQKYLEVIK